ncbi:lipopolysaccharide biosynthesis protein, partial [Bacteroides cellulosilyticus]
STTLLSVSIGSLVFVALGLLFLEPIAGWLEYGEHPWYIGMMMIVVAMDAIQSIPFAYLRYKKRPIKFAALKLLFIFLNIALNLFYYVILEGNDVGYAFLFNLVCTSVVMVCMIPELRGFTYVLDKELLKRMLRYSLPLVILGVAGILNQVADKIIFPFVYPDEAEATIQLGIYGAASKIAMIMAMFTQAFRFAYEPFVFGKSKEKDSREMYAQAMKFFIIFTLLAFLAVMFYLDILRHVIGRDYWDGLRVVPIVMAAEIFMGIYFNLSFWYKLIDETRWGAYFSLTGCIILILMNIFLVPKYGYIACAWAGFTGYGVAMLLSYFVGQKKYPIQYDLKAIGMYVLFAAVLYVAAEYVSIDNIYLRMAYRTVLLLLFIAYVVKRDLPLNQIPILNKLLKH